MRPPLFDFTDPSAANPWHAIDDRVMGGISRSTPRHDPAGHAVFEGTVALERNGGFALVRSGPGERGLAGAKVCLIQPRGDNKQFKWQAILRAPLLLDVKRWCRSALPPVARAGLHGPK